VVFCLVSDAVSVTLRDSSQFSQLMQQHFRSYSHFSQRTEILANHLGLMLGDLPALIGVSARMFYGYRTGKYPLTDKAWRKLEAAEETAELPKGIHSFRSEPPTLPLLTQIADLTGPLESRELGGVLERIAIALEKLVEFEEKKNSNPKNNL
jgi:hypothetical protein